MPPMKIQPIDVDTQNLRGFVRNDSAKPVLKSRLRRFFDWQFNGVSKTSSAEKSIPAADTHSNTKDGGRTEFEPSTVCLAKMVQNFIEETNEEPQPAVKCRRNRCNCFNGYGNESSVDDDFDVFGNFGETWNSGSSGGDANDVLKSLIACASNSERNLLADTSTIVDKQSKAHKRKDDLKIIVTDGLSCLGYDSSICVSKWEKTPSFPAGEYEYIDVLVEGERLLVDIDFRSEFEVARPTGTYKSILQSLPYIFVGKSDRLGQIVSVVSESAKQSLKKKGMHIPPWRKTEYMRAKWLSPCNRVKQPPSTQEDTVIPTSINSKDHNLEEVCADSDSGELEAISLETTSLPGAENGDGSGDGENLGTKLDTEKESVQVGMPAWQPPAIRPKSVDRVGKVVTGLASLLNDKP